MEKKKFWLKLDKDFLKSPQMKVLRNMENGKDYIIFYLTLMLESIDSVGHLRFTEKIPYSLEMLASVTDTNIDVARSAFKVFQELGLIETLDDGTIFLPEVAEMTGKECDSASRVRDYRSRKLLQCNEDVTFSNNSVTNKETDVTKCNDNIKKRREENKEEIKEELYITTTTTNKIVSIIEKNYNRKLCEVEIEQLKSWLLSWPYEIIIHAIRLSVLSNKKEFRYVEGILKNWQARGFKTIEQVLADNRLANSNEELFDYDWINDCDLGKE